MSVNRLNEIRFKPMAQCSGSKPSLKFGQASLRRPAPARVIEEEQERKYLGDTTTFSYRA